MKNNQNILNENDVCNNFIISDYFTIAITLFTLVIGVSALIYVYYIY